LSTYLRQIAGEAASHVRRERIRRQSKLVGDYVAREPEAAERDRILTFLGGEGSWDSLAHVLFNAKEFIFLR
jgi:hypothetical protein